MKDAVARVDGAAMEPGTYGRDDAMGRVRRSRPGEGAAMEPGTYGRDDSTSEAKRLAEVAAAMEPGTYGRDDDVTVEHHRGAGMAAAMEPGTYGRDDWAMVPSGWAIFSRWPQWSPALTAGMTAWKSQTTWCVAGPPQWSPALTAGMTRPRCRLWVR